MTRTIVVLTIVAVISGCGGKPAQPVEAKAPQSASTNSSTASATSADATPTTPVATASTSAHASLPQPTANYADLVAEADKFINARDFNNGVRALSQALAVNPQGLDAYIKRAAIFAEAKLLNRAIQDISIAIKLDPKNAKLRNTCGYFHLLQKDYEAAEQNFNAAIDLDAKYPHALNNRGLVFLSTDNEIKASNDFKEAIEIKPDYVDAHNNLGFAYIQMEEYELAIEALTKALELNPQYLNALTNRGRAYGKLDNTDAAIADYTKCIELAPGNMQFYVLRAEAHQVAQHTELAAQDRAYVAWYSELQELNQRIARNQQDPSLWVARGRHLLQGEEWKAAGEAFESALKCDPDFAEAFVGRALISWHDAAYDDVIKHCTKALLNEPLHEAYSLRGDAYLQRNELDLAIADYEAGKRIDAQVQQAYLKRAEQRKQSGDIQLASHDEAQAELIEKRLSGEFEPSADTGTPRVMKVEAANFTEPVNETN